METVLTLLKEGIGGGILSILRISLILVPVMVVIEITRHYNVLQLAALKIKRFLRFLTLPTEAAFPLVVGVGFGIVLGAALIIEYAREGRLNKRDLLLIGIFLSLSHSAVEDTLIFVVFGANPLVLFFFRFILAVLVTRAAALIMDFNAARRGPMHARGE